MMMKLNERGQALAAIVLLSIVAIGCGPADGGAQLGADAGANKDDSPDQPDPDDPPSCEEVRPIEVSEAGPPDLLLVVDKSDSMNASLSTGQQKWAVMRGALTSLVNGNADGIRFGLAAYPSDTACGIGALYADVGDDNGAAIVSALSGMTAAGGTPTHTTLQGALNYFLDQPANPDGRYVLLATDGEPNCGDLFDPYASMVDESIDAIEALSQNGIATFVLGFGAEINSQPQVLQAMAVAGGTSLHYAANSPQELSAALDQIASQVSGPECEMVLGEMPGDSSKLQVFFDDVEIGRSSSHTDGFDYDEQKNSIVFYGPACDSLQSGQVAEVRVDYGCSGHIID